MFSIRLDMRAPSHGRATTGELYAAALAMAEWSERQGAALAMVSEHHASPDGYLPSPFVLASAIAGRTRTLPIQVAALILPLHDPIRVAEDMVILDHVSRGRVSYVLVVGYREAEYAMFGRSMKGRGRRMEASLEALGRAFAGEPFEYEGRPVHVTPAPFTPGGPMLLMGGNSPVVARRAARFGLGLITQGGDPSLETIYREECQRLGREPGLCANPQAGTVTSAFVAEDPDRAWQEMGPYLLHDARMYAEWLADSTAVTKATASSVEELRRTPDCPYRIFTPEEAVAYTRQHGMLMTQPLCGGLPPDLAWPSLELIAARVLPALRPASS